jgi:hypothetical protein
MHCSPFDLRKSPLAPLFQRGGLLWNPNELGAAYKRVSPFFQRGIKGDFKALVPTWMMATVRGRLSNQ